MVAGTTYLLSLGAALVLWTSWSLGAYVSRFTSPPTNLAELAPMQVTGLIPAGLIAAGGAALATSRLRTTGARELLRQASRPSWELSGRLVLEICAAVCGGWLLYWVLSAVRFRGDGSGTRTSVLALVTSLSTIPVSAVIGHLAGRSLPRAVATPVATVLVYCFFLLGGALGDDRWWQGLNPSLGPAFGPHTSSIWFIGEVVWFLGLTGLLLAAVVHTQARPRVSPVALPMLAGLVAGVALIVLALLNVT